MVELDVQMTWDGRLVIFHDDRLERTTNGAGVLTGVRYSQIAQLDAGAWFHPRFAGERILLVSQAIRLVPPPLRINLELKHTHTRSALLRCLLRVVRRARLGKRLLLSSFDPDLLRPLGPTRLALALICRSDPDRSLQQAVRLRCEAWHPFHTLVTPQRIARAHAAGLRVHAWTIDDLRGARRLARWGVDGLFTNHPARLSRLLSRKERP
jgi:glycerophosphoryl diester phosphodiesterase